MTREYIDTEVMLPKPGDEKPPVWDNYIKSVNIRGYIPSFIRIRIAKGIMLLDKGYPIRFSDRAFIGEIHNVLNTTAEKVYKDHRLTYTKLIVARKDNSLLIRVPGAEVFDIISK